MTKTYRMSFRHTVRQIQSQEKTQTRRKYAPYIHLGDTLVAHANGHHLAKLRVTALRKELLCDITQPDVIAEGFFCTPALFVAHFCHLMHCEPDQLVYVIQFAYLGRQMPIPF